MKKILLFVFSLVTGQLVFSQGNVGIGTNSPDASAALDISSNNKGMLVPRMNSGQRKLIANPATGLLVFDTDKGCIYMYDGNQWLPLQPGLANNPTVHIRSTANQQLNAGFGAVVALSGNYAVITASKQDLPASAVDTVFVFYKSNGAWLQQAKLTQSDAVPGDRFGYAVAISGDYILVGAPFHNGSKGAVYAFSRSGTNWAQTAIITPTIEQAASYFGSTISISGTFAMISAPDWDWNAANQGTGTIYCYNRNALGWQPTQQLTGIVGLTSFGYAISISGTLAVIGAPYSNYNGIHNTGIAYFYKRSGTTWVPADTIYNTSGNPDEAFGYSVAISESKGWVFIADYDGGEGSLKGYKVQGTQLTLVSSLSSPNTAPPGGNNEVFGSSLSMYDDFLIVGATGERNQGTCDGRVYIYKWDGARSDGYKWVIYKTIIDNSSPPENLWLVSLGYAVCINGFTLLIGNASADGQRGKVLFVELE
jgi:hypothetical protein